MVNSSILRSEWIVELIKMPLVKSPRQGTKLKSMVSARL